ncbi:hypothetical protein [Agrococcus sp. SCSIO52902]|uniref:hypothetical protein n=1 Tax=Agrococcus sp. SCSIO52902 TaxID=2933290 RepID=UPI001FF447DA|nr:hypothetical protein [Agrococcus sp. SCSIO52902]UOW02019.1 hypothetical protein MU522_06390 [Agrococcus sp. SCSIO52902]
MSAPAQPRSEGIAAEQRRGVQVVEKTGPWGFFFLLAYIGAAIYFVGQSGGGFWAVILGLLQAMVWPVYLIFHALEAVGA